MLYLKNKIYIFLLLLLVFSSLFLIEPASASVTNGTIDSFYKYAWGENIGWVNFGADSSNIEITDAAITGYAWSENYGWINLSPATSGVVNDNEGNLSGNAWGESLGWIDFEGVLIDSRGYFSGYATISRDSSRISFNCSNTSSCEDSDFKLKTDWRPRGERPECNNSIDDDGDGQIDYPDDPGCFSLLDDNEIDENAIKTYEKPEEEIQENIEEDEQEKEDEEEIVQDEEEIIVDEPVEEEKEEEKGAEAEKEKKKQDISQYDYTEKEEKKEENFLKKIAKTIKENLIDNVKDKIKNLLPDLLEKIKKGDDQKGQEKRSFFKKIANKIFKPKEIESPRLDIERIVKKEAPISLKSRWSLIDSRRVEKFVFAPMPNDFEVLAAKFKDLEKTFTKVGVNRATDIKKLENVNLSLPGLTKASGMQGIKISKKMDELKTIPLSKLNSEFKQQLPSEIVFTRSGGGIIDHNIKLFLTDKGRAKQKINTVTGKMLDLAVKVEGNAKSVRGYIVFKSNKHNKVSLEMPVNSLFSSALFAKPVLASQEKTVKIDKELVLLSFEYFDDDNDGIYTAQIQAPVVDGEYEVITVIEYEDPEEGTKVIRLIVAVDPEGYVYEEYKGNEIRVSGAVVSIYWLNSETGEYEIWTAEEYNQTNFQVVDKTGRYSFLTPPGKYYLRAEAEGYINYKGKPFDVVEGDGVHFNIQLKKSGWNLDNIDWKTYILILVSIIALYNLYKNMRRARKRRREREEEAAENEAESEEE